MAVGGWSGSRVGGQTVGRIAGLFVTLIQKVMEKNRSSFTAP